MSTSKPKKTYNFKFEQAVVYNHYCTIGGVKFTTDFLGDVFYDLSKKDIGFKYNLKYIPTDYAIPLLKLHVIRQPDSMLYKYVENNNYYTDGENFHKFFDAFFEQLRST